MAWFYDMLINSGVDATAASWGTATAAALLLYAVQLTLTLFATIVIFKLLTRLIHSKEDKK